ncbi:hypothetical protein N1851_003823 [Merluccius polli]|uniref:Uncharacterized protein n=1 Tax=Merluccius polli TaxID=89951 RepID=A0AA47N7X0_MERPO|nr:hypothetical protein N1851_003823 [Merluccius polli]
MGFCLSNRRSCAPLGLPVPAYCLWSPTGRKGPIGLLLQFDGIPHRPCPPAAPLKYVRTFLGTTTEETVSRQINQLWEHLGNLTPPDGMIRVGSAFPSGIVPLESLWEGRKYWLLIG